ncbi:MAG: hypothetical protein KDE27_04775, partial [Planctomycetes bacterium]|nr:hypothetical protein [Planctomycetota bacterium]
FALLPRVRPFLQRERESEFEDVKLFRYGNMLGYDLWLAVGRGVFTIGGGYDVETRIGEVLDRCKSLPAELPAERSLPEGFGPLRRFLPPGCHGYALGSATDVVALPTELWLELLGEFVPIVGAGGVGDPDAAADLREQRRALLRQHGLDVARTATGYADATWRLRFFW